MVGINSHRTTGYGAIPAGRMSTRSRSMLSLQAKAAAVLAGTALTACVLFVGSQHHVELYYHGMHDYVTWEGCGPGGSCGPKYTWDSHSFSPNGYTTQSYTHDHSSWGNYWSNETGWTVGAHKEFPFEGTRPFGWLDRAIFGNNSNSTRNATNATNATGPESWFEQPMSSWDFFAKIFPIEKGYSSKIFDRLGLSITPPAGVNGTNSTGMTNNTNSTNVTAAVKEVWDNEAEVAEGEAEERWKLRGRNKPMIFNDLPVVAGFAPIQAPIMIKVDDY